MRFALNLASFGVSGLAYLQRHVLAILHEAQDTRVVRVFVTLVSTAFSGDFAIHFHGDSGVRDANRKRFIHPFTMFKGVDESQDSRLFTPVWQLIVLADSRSTKCLLRMPLQSNRGDLL